MTSTTAPADAAGTAPQSTSQRVDITATDLPLHCPMPRTPIWSAHPRVFLNLNAAGEAKCPYCGTHYVFSGPRAGGGH